jgi:hypothetical protein
MKQAIQFIGTQRSGSNLLRVMLNQHPEISAPHPPHILQVMMPLLPMYGDLNNAASFEKLIDDACILVEKNPVNWSVKFDRTAIAAMCENKSLPQIMQAIYLTKAKTKNASWWCCKSMANIHYTKEIEASGIHPMYLFQYRDGRDVACSFRNAVVGEKHMYFLAKQWKLEQDLSLELLKQLGIARVITVRYEDFIVDAASTLRDICGKLQIEYTAEMLNYADADESKITASSGKMWSNLTKPLMRNNSKKYLKELSHDDLVVFESVAGDTLEKLGYTREIATKRLRKYSEADVKQFDVHNKLWQSEAKALAADDMSKRREQDLFIAELKNEFSAYEKSGVTRVK